MSDKTDKLFNIYGYTGGNYAGNVYGINGIAPTINCMGGGNRMPLILKEEYVDEHMGQERASSCNNNSDK